MTSNRTLGRTMLMCGIVLAVFGGIWLAISSWWPIGYVFTGIGSFMMGVASMYLDPPDPR